MSRLTITIDEAQDAVLESIVDERGVYESKSAAVRAYLPSGEDGDEPITADAYERMKAERDRLQERVEGLETAVEQAEARADDLRRQLSQANARNDDVDDLVRAVEAERSLAERKARAGLTTRLKWWVTGMPDEGEDDEE